MCLCFNGLTSGKTPGNKRDVAALETQAVSQEVPQLVVAGEVDDGGRYSHDPAHTHANKQRFQMSECWDNTRHCAVSFVTEGKLTS